MKLRNRTLMLLQQVNQMIADVDKDGSGAIDFDEFVSMITAKIGERDFQEELMKAFRIIDQDNNVKFVNILPLPIFLYLILSLSRIYMYAWIHVYGTFVGLP